MTTQEARDWFRDSLKDGKCSDECPQCNAMEKAVEALEKQIPKEPIFKRHPKFKTMSYFCPNCGAWRLWEDEVPNKSDSYCSDCGQALDWTEKALAKDNENE